MTKFAEAIATLIESNEKLFKFKTYVHETLDAWGIDTNPPGKHADAGCRIGQRLQVVRAMLDDLNNKLKNDANADWQSSYVELSTRYERLRKEGERVANENNDLRKRLSLAETKLGLCITPEGVIAERDEWKRRAELAEIQAKQAYSELDGARANAKEWKEKHDKAMVSLSGEKETSAARFVKIEKLERELAEANTRANDFKTSLAAEQGFYASAKKELAEANTRATNSETSSDVWAMRAGKLDKELAELKKLLKQKDERAANAEQETKCVNAKYQETLNALVNVTKERDNAQDKANQRYDKIKELRKELDEAKRTNPAAFELQMKLEAQTAACLNAITERDVYRKEMSFWRDKCEEAEKGSLELARRLDASIAFSPNVCPRCGEEQRQQAEASSNAMAINKLLDYMQKPQDTQPESEPTTQSYSDRYAVYYPPGCTTNNGVSQSNSDLAFAMLKDLEAGKSVVAPHGFHIEKLTR